MTRTVLAPLTLLLVTATLSADPVPAEKVAFKRYAGLFEKNTSGLPGPTSFLLLSSREAFDKGFGTLPPIKGFNPTPLPADVFDKHVVVAVITRADAPTEYSDVTATVAGTTLTVAYQAKTGPATSAKYASPLILALPKGKFTEVSFVSDGKVVGQAK
jgi:hypothetical protein